MDQIEHCRNPSTRQRANPDSAPLVWPKAFPEFIPRNNFARPLESATSATRGVEMPTKDQRQIAPPTPDEVWKLVDAGEEIGGQGRDMIFVDAFTGLRRNEILALQYTDVDWTNKELVVNKAVSKTKVSDGVQKWEWWIGPPKSRKSNRRVAAAEAVLELLRRLQAEAKIPPVSCSSDLTENGWNPITSTDSSSAE